MTSLEKVDFSEYHSFLTYHGIFPTGLLSESDLDYLAFRLKIFSTSDSVYPSPSSSSSLFELVRTPPTKSNQLISQPLSPAMSADWSMPDRSSDPLKPHVCDFHDDLSPCWSRQCELWEGIHSDDQSHEYNAYFSDLAAGAARVDGVKSLSVVGQAEASAHAQRRRNSGVGVSS